MFSFKHILLAILIALMSFTAHATFSALEKNLIGLEDILQAIIFKEFGKMKLPVEQEEYVRALIKELGIERPICVYAMNSVGIALFGTMNAFAALNTIYIGQEFFSAISTQEQRFVIAHELGHIDRHHVLLKYCVRYTFFPSTMLLWYSLWRYVPLFQKNNVQSLACNSAYFVLLQSLSTLLTKYIDRYLEFDADAFAIKKLHEYHGGIQFFMRMEQVQKTALDPWYKRLLLTHPSNHERIVHAEGLQKKLI